MYNVLTSLANNPIIVVFILANVAIGLWSHRKSRAGSFEDYALASRSLPTAVLMMTLLGTFLSGTYLSTADRFCTYGLVHAIQIFSIVLCFILIGTFIAPKLVHFNNKLTAGGLMRDFYGPSGQLFAGIVGLFTCLLIIILEISALGRLAMIVLSMKFSSAVIIFGSLTVLYSMWGGLRSVSYTDILQMVAFFVFLSVVSSVILIKVGGTKEIFSKVFTSFPEKVSIMDSPYFYNRLKSCFLIAFSLSFVVPPPVMHRMLVTQDKRQIRRMWYGSALIFACVIGLIIMISFAILGSPDILGLTGKRDLLPHLVKNLFSAHPTVLGCMFIGMVSVILSTIDSFLHTAGIVLVEDIITPLRSFSKRKGMSKHQKILCARISMGLIGLVAIVMGSQANHTLHHANAKILLPTLLLYVAVNLPLVLGLLGLKTDTKSWLSFVITYLGTLTFLLATGWKAETRFYAYYDCSLVAAPLGILAYLLMHLYVNRGFVVLKRKADTVSEHLWVPSPRNIGKVLGRLLGNTLHLPTVAKQEVEHNKPAQSLGFSLMMLTLYMLGSVVLADGSESFAMFMGVIRAIGITFCCVLMLEGLWGTTLKRYFPLYWLGALIYCLPLTATLSFLRMHDGIVSVLFFVGSFVLLALLVSSRAFVWMSLVGILSAYGGWYAMMGSLPLGLSQDGAFISGWVAVIILLIGVIAFAGRSEGFSSDKLYMTRAVASSIPHEARAQLSGVMGVQFFSDRVNKSLVEIKNKEGEEGFFLSKDMQARVSESANIIDHSMTQVTETFTRLTRILNRDISAEKQEQVSIEHLVEEVLPTLPKKYGENIKVSVVCKQDFEALVLRHFFGHVLLNMAKNAEKHGAAKEISITIDGAARTVEIRDNGKGIPESSLAHIFDLGFSTGGMYNHGVGLALAKMILAASGVRISCTSRTGNGSYTSFVLTFPQE